jgi:hypothetical protein
MAASHGSGGSWSPKTTSGGWWSGLYWSWLSAPSLVDDKCWPPFSGVSSMVLVCHVEVDLAIDVRTRRNLSIGEACKRC